MALTFCLSPEPVTKNTLPKAPSPRVLSITNSSDVAIAERCQLRLDGNIAAVVLQHKLVYCVDVGVKS